MYKNQLNLRTKILAEEIKNNYDALHFVHDEGHIANHAAEVEFFNDYFFLLLYGD